MDFSHQGEAQKEAQGEAEEEPTPHQPIPLLFFYGVQPTDHY